MTKQKSFGVFVKDLRLAKKIGVRQLAKSITKEDGTNISPAYLIDIEKNARIPSAFIVEQLAKVLGYDPDALLHMAEKISPEVEKQMISDPAIGRLLRKAKEKGFKNWDELEKHL